MSERDAYPALAALADNVDMDRPLPEAIQCYLELGALRVRLADLRQWKQEATEVLRAWDLVWDQAGRPGPLGSSKPEAVSRALVRLHEALRRHVVDWGECDSPESCVCSHARAMRELGAFPCPICGDEDMSEDGIQTCRAYRGRKKDSHRYEVAEVVITPRLLDTESATATSANPQATTGSTA